MLHASGTPPTRVLTVNNPQLAASNIAMQNASVKELSEDQDCCKEEHSAVTDKKTNVELCEF